MNTQPTPETEVWETYCDECYYHMWRLRRKTERGWHDGFHINTGEEAKALCETLNKLERERDEAREELSEWRILNGWGGTPEIINDFIKGQQTRIHHAQDLEEELATVTEQRDRLAEEIKQLKSQLTRTQGAVTISRNGYVQELEQQRDRLAAVLQRIRDGYGGQVASPNCCEDCDYLLPIDEALQSLTQKP
jgi:DNA repair exonuclease SbcCD ATPase subunit